MTPSIAKQEELDRLVAYLDVNLGFITELLQADIRLFIRQADGKIALYNYYQSNRDSLYMDAHNLDKTKGKTLDAHKDIFVHKAFEHGRPVIGQYGLVINNRPIQEFAYPIVMPDDSKEVVAVIAVERDIYLTRASLGQHWDSIADNLVRSLQERINTKQTQVRFPLISLGEGVIIVRKPSNIFFISPFAIHLLSELGGHHSNQFVGRSLDELFAGCLRKSRGKNPRAAIAQIEEVSLARRTVVLRYIDINAEISVVLIKDISEIKIKDTLLREIHHRVKNNIQTVSSLLRMQSRRYPELKEAFNEAISRTSSISLVHETLSTAEDIEQVDFGSLAGTIIREVVASFGVQDLKLNFHCPEKVFIISEKATNLALVLNELLSNSLEHAGSSLGEININLYAEPGKLPHTQDLLLVVEDNGKGFPEGFDYKTNSGLGWEIVRNLAEDSLGAEVTLENRKSGGARVKLRLPSIILTN